MGVCCTATDTPYFNTIPSKNLAPYIPIGKSTRFTAICVKIASECIQEMPMADFKAEFGSDVLKREILGIAKELQSLDKAFKSSADNLETQSRRMVSSIRDISNAMNRLPTSRDQKGSFALLNDLKAATKDFPTKSKISNVANGINDIADAFIKMSGVKIDTATAEHITVLGAAIKSYPSSTKKVAEEISNLAEILDKISAINSATIIRSIKEIVDGLRDLGSINTNALAIVGDPLQEIGRDVLELKDVARILNSVGSAVSGFAKDGENINSTKIVSSLNSIIIGFRDLQGIDIRRLERISLPLRRLAGSVEIFAETIKTAATPGFEDGFNTLIGILGRLKTLNQDDGQVKGFNALKLSIRALFNALDFAKLGEKGTAVDQLGVSLFQLGNVFRKNTDVNQNIRDFADSLQPLNSIRLVFKNIADATKDFNPRGFNSLLSSIKEAKIENINEFSSSLISLRLVAAPLRNFSAAMRDFDTDRVLDMVKALDTLNQLNRRTNFEALFNLKPSFSDRFDELGAFATAVQPLNRVSDALRDFGNASSTINRGGITEMINSLSEITNLLTQSTRKNIDTGITNLVDNTNKLGKVAAPLKQLGDASQNINRSSIKNFVFGLQQLSSISSVTRDALGKRQQTGVDRLADNVIGLNRVAQSLQQLGNAAQTINRDSINSMMEGLDEITKAFNIFLAPKRALPRLVLDFKGSIERFADSIAPLVSVGEGFKKFSESVQNIDRASIDDFLNGLSRLAGQFNLFRKTRFNPLEIFGGFSTGIKRFANSVKPLLEVADAFQDFGVAIKNIDTDRTSEFINSLDLLSKATRELSGGIPGFNRFERGLAAFARSTKPLEESADSLGKLGRAVQNIDKESIRNFSGGLTELSEFGKSVSGIQGVFNGFQRGLNQFTRAIDPLSNALEKLGNIRDANKIRDNLLAIKTVLEEVSQEFQQSKSTFNSLGDALAEISRATDALGKGFLRTASITNNLNALAGGIDKVGGSAKRNSASIRGVARDFESFGKISDVKLPDLSSVFDGLGKQIGKDIAEEIGKAISRELRTSNEVRRGGQGIADDLSEGFGSGVKRKRREFGVADEISNANSAREISGAAGSVATGFVDGLRRSFANKADALRRIILNPLDFRNNADLISRNFFEFGRNIQDNMVRGLFDGNRLRSALSDYGEILQGFGDIARETIQRLGEPIRLAVEFESGIADIVKTLPAEFSDNAQFVEELSLSLRDLATGDSPLAGLENATQQLTDIASAAGQLGIAAPEILGFTEAVGKLTIASDLGAEEGAFALARFSAVTGETDFAGVGSALVNLGNNFAATESEITEFAERLAGAGTSAGLSSDEILALGAAMANVGLNAEAGGTAFTTILNEMVKASASFETTTISGTQAIANQNNAIASANARLVELASKRSDLTDKINSSSKSISEENKALARQQLSEVENEIAQLNARVAQGQDALGNIDPSAVITSVGQVTKELEVFASVAQSALEGLTPEEQANQFRNFGEIATAALEDGQISVEEFATVFQEEGNEAIQLFLAGLGELDAAAQIDALDALGLDGIRTADTLRRLALSGEDVTQAFILASEGMFEFDALTEEANARFATTAAQINRMRNILRDLGIEIGNLLLPQINRQITAFGDLLTVVRDAIRINPDLVQGFLELGQRVAFAVVKATAFSLAITNIVPVIAGLAAFIISPVGIGLAIITLTQSLLQFTEVGTVFRSTIGNILSELSLLTNGLFAVKDAIDAVLQTPIKPEQTVGGEKENELLERRAELLQQVADLESGNAQLSTQSTQRTIEAGDTLSAIVAELQAAGENVTLEDLLAANAGIDPRALQIGQEINIPIGVSADPEAAARTAADLQEQINEIDQQIAGAGTEFDEKKFQRDQERKVRVAEQISRDLETKGFFKTIVGDESPERVREFSRDLLKTAEDFDNVKTQAIAFNDALGALGRKEDGAVDLVKTAFNGLTGEIEVFGDRVRQLLLGDQTIAEFFGGLGARIGTEIKTKVLPLLRPSLGAIAGAIQSTIGGAAVSSFSFLANVLKSITSIDLLPFADDIETFFDSIDDFASALFDSIAPGIQEAFDTIRESLASTFRADEGGFDLESITEGMRRAATIIGSVIGSLATTIATAFVQVSEIFRSFGDIFSGGEGLGGRIGDFFGELLNAIPNTLLSGLGQLAIDITEGLNLSVNVAALLNNLGFDVTPEEVTEFLTNAQTTISTLFDSISFAAGDFLAVAGSLIAGFAADVITVINTTDAINIADDIITQIGSGFATAFESGGQFLAQATSLISAIVADIQSLFDAPPQDLLDKFNNVGVAVLGLAVGGVVLAFTAPLGALGLATLGIGALLVGVIATDLGDIGTIIGENTELPQRFTEMRDAVLGILVDNFNLPEDFSLGSISSKIVDEIKLAFDFDDADIQEFTDTFSEIGTGITGFVDGFKIGFEGFDAQATLTGIKALAGAIAVVAGVVTLESAALIASLLPPIGQAIGGFITVIAGVFTLFADPKQGLEDIGQGLSSIIDAISDLGVLALLGSAEGLLNILDKIAVLAGALTGNDFSGFSEAIRSLTDNIDKLQEFFVTGNILDAMIALFDAISLRVQLLIAETIASASQQLPEFIRNQQFGSTFEESNVGAQASLRLQIDPTSTENITFANDALSAIQTALNDPKLKEEERALLEQRANEIFTLLGTAIAEGEISEEDVARAQEAVARATNEIFNVPSNEPTTLDTEFGGSTEAVANQSFENLMAVGDGEVSPELRDSILSTIDATVASLQGEGLTGASLASSLDIVETIFQSTELQEDTGIADSLAQLILAGGTDLQNNELFQTAISELGLSIPLGISDGLVSEDALTALSDGSTAFGDAVEAAIAETLQAQSPAQRMVPLGEAIVAGVVQGIDGQLVQLGLALAKFSIQIAIATPLIVAPAINLAQQLSAAFTPLISTIVKLGQEAQNTANRLLFLAKAKLAVDSPEDFFSEGGVFSFATGGIFGVRDARGFNGSFIAGDSPTGQPDFRELIVTDQSVAILNNRTTEAFLEGFRSARGISQFGALNSFANGGSPQLQMPPSPSLSAGFGSSFTENTIMNVALTIPLSGSATIDDANLIADTVANRLESLRSGGTFSDRAARGGVL